MKDLAFPLLKHLREKVPVVAYQDCEGVNQYVINNKNGLMVERDHNGDTIACALDQLMKGATLAKNVE